MSALRRARIIAPVMQYQILVKPENQNGFVASVIGLPECRAEGKTKEEAIEKAKQALNAQLAESEIIMVEVEAPAAKQHPLLKHFGRFKDDDTFDDFLAHIEAYRRQLDEEEAAR